MPLKIDTSKATKPDAPKDPKLEDTINRLELKTPPKKEKKEPTKTKNNILSR